MMKRRRRKDDDAKTLLELLLEGSFVLNIFLTDDPDPRLGIALHFMEKKKKKTD